MGGVRVRRYPRPRLGALPLVFVLAALMLTTVWDADGDPTTDNLPAATLTISPRTVRSVDAESDGTKEEAPGIRPSRRWRLGRNSQHFLREWIWEFAAVPSRGP